LFFFLLLQYNKKHNSARDFGPRLITYYYGWGQASFQGYEVYIIGPLRKFQISVSFVFQCNKKRLTKNLIFTCIIINLFIINIMVVGAPIGAILADGILY